jgi:hypothetical protein
MYVVTQESLARVFVEALAAYVTGGASALSASARIPAQTLRSQLATPKVLLATIAMFQLDEALLRYDRIQHLTNRMSLAGIDVNNAEGAFAAYLQAYVLEQSGAALANALMPKSGIDLIGSALEAVGDTTASPA